MTVENVIQSPIVNFIAENKCNIKKFIEQISLEIDQIKYLIFYMNHFLRLRPVR